MRILVVTIVHTPLDARIHARQIGALRAAGHDVTYVAPFAATGTDPSAVAPGVSPIDVPRAVGRARSVALRAARRIVQAHAPRHDLVLVHDPELVGIVPANRGLKDTVVVWDVHEDTGAALVDKRWLPDAARPAVGAIVGGLESWAERNLKLLLAEARYGERLTGGPDGPHPVVPNTPVIPDEPAPGPDHPHRVVHLGRLSVNRGVHDLLAVGRLLAGEVEVHLIGEPDADVADDVTAAAEAGHVVFHGFVPNDQALPMVQGSLAGLALLRDLPNYQHSMPTKLYEYLGRGVPVITTPLPEARALVEASAGGVVVPFLDPEAVASAVRSLGADAEHARAMGLRGHAHVHLNHAWNVDGPAFVDLLEAWVAQSRQ